MTQLDPRLVRAKSNLAIAEAKDSKREAYKRAAKDIVAYKKDTGDNLTEIAIKLGRVSARDDRAARQVGGTYIGKLVKWHDEGFLTETPFGGEKETHRKQIVHAKTVVKDPVKRAEFVESLTEQEKIDLTEEVFQSTTKPIRDDKKRRKAVAEEQYEDPRQATRGKAAIAAAGAVNALRAFVVIVRDENWNKKERNWLLTRLDRVEGALETARLAATGADQVDWDEELARLNDEAATMEGGA